MTAPLLVMLGEHDVRRLTRDDAGTFTFEYEEAWLADAGAYPLSISMPLTRARRAVVSQSVRTRPWSQR